MGDCLPDPRLANPDNYSTFRRQVLDVPPPGVLQNDEFSPPCSVTAQLVTPLAPEESGTLVFRPDGSFTYTPSGDFAGNATFSYRFVHIHGPSNTALVTLTVINRPPVAVDDAYTMLHDTTLNANPSVLMNDSDLDGDPLTAQLVGSPPPGDFSFNSDGTFIYTPPELFRGQVTFTYAAHDGIASSNTATVTITVTNNAPVAQADTYELPPGATLTENAPGVLGNDYDPDGDAITAVFEPGHGPLYGTLSYFDPDGSFRYTPDDPKFVGTDTFAYKAYDGIDYSGVALVTLNYSADERVSYLLEEQVEAVRAEQEAGTLEKARAIGYLAGITLKAIEAGNLAARLEMLEMVLKKRNEEAAG